MESKKWLWIVIVCLAIVAVYQVLRITGGNSAESPSPEIEPSFQPDQRPTQTASFAEQPGMLEEKKQTVVELAKEEIPQGPSTVTIESSAPSPEEQGTPAMQDPTLPVSDPPEVDAIQAPPATALVAKSSNRGLVRGIIYSEDRGSALIGETLVQAGAIIDGVKVVNIHAGGVEFEKEDQRWNQKVGEAPDVQWR